MSRNNNYQQIQEAASSIPSSTKEFLRTQQKDIVCNDCGGISATKVQQLLSTLEGTTQLFNTPPSSSNRIKSSMTHRKKSNRPISKPKKKDSARINSQKTSLRKNLKKKNPNKRIKQRKLNTNGIRSTLSSRNNNNKIRLKSKKSHTIKNKKLSLKKK